MSGRLKELVPHDTCQTPEKAGPRAAFLLFAVTAALAPLPFAVTAAKALVAEDQSSCGKQGWPKVTAKKLFRD